MNEQSRILRGFLILALFAFSACDARLDRGKFISGYEFYFSSKTFATFLFSDDQTTKLLRRKRKLKAEQENYVRLTFSRWIDYKI